METADCSHVVLIFVEWWRSGGPGTTHSLTHSLTCCRWCRRHCFLPRTAPVLGKHAEPVEQSVPGRTNHRRRKFIIKEHIRETRGKRQGSRSVHRQQPAGRGVGVPVAEQAAAGWSRWAGQARWSEWGRWRWNLRLLQGSAWRLDKRNCRQLLKTTTKRVN